MTQPTPTSGLLKSSYARRANRLIRIIGETRALGGQSVVDLPRIAVIGNQSAGKSSLVEAIAEIKVPRGMGTCTRCPMEFRLENQPDTEWHAQVYLRFEPSSSSRENHNNETLFGPIITSKEELESMLRRAQMAVLNPMVNSQSFVDLDLKAVGDYSYPFGNEPPLSFSSDVVCLTVWGPDVPDLSFIDLPGIIQNENEAGSIEAVRNMVTKHIQGNCLILLVISMRDDIENQSAVHLAKQVDPDGKRTVGVLTKPDTIQEREERRWLDIIEGRLHQLALGYYMTKQPAPADLERNIDHSEAREAEKAFFQTSPIWSKCTERSRSKMGTPSLSVALSKLLSHLIDQTLPGIRRDLGHQQELCSSMLAAIPPKLSQPPAVALLNLITSYSQSLDSLVQGGPGQRKMIQQCNDAFRDFRRDVRGTAPNFIPKLRHDTDQNTLPARAPAAPKPLDLKLVRRGNDFSVLTAAPFTIHWYHPFINPSNYLAGRVHSGGPPNIELPPSWTHKDSPEELRVKAWEARKQRQLELASRTLLRDAFATTKKVNVHAAQNTELPAPAAVVNSSALTQRITSAPTSVSNVPPVPLSPILSHELYVDQTDDSDDESGQTGQNIIVRMPRKTQPIYLDDIRNIITSHVTRELPYNVPFSAKLEAITNSFEQWDSMAAKCADQITLSCRNEAMSITRTLFGQFKYGELDRIALTVTDQQITLLSKRVKERLQWMVGMESAPYTQNLHYFSLYRDKYLGRYKAERQQNLGHIDPTPVEAAALQAAIAAVRAAGFNVEGQADLERLRAPDQYEQELIVAAEVRAYFQIAYKRIIDNVPRIIDQDFVKNLRPSIEDAFHAKLFSDALVAAECMSEDPQIAEERANLEEKSERLRDIENRLNFSVVEV